MESFIADSGTEVGTESHPVQPLQRFFSPVPVQFNAIGTALISVSQRPQRKPASAAGVEQVNSNAIWELNAPRQMFYMLKVGGVVAHLYVIHQPAYDGIVCGY